MIRPLNHLSYSSSQKQNRNSINQNFYPQVTENFQKKINTCKPQRIAFTERNETEICSNQDGRVATHWVTQSEEVVNYCQKCAIMAASKGFSVEKLSRMHQSYGGSNLMNKPSLFNNKTLPVNRNRNSTINARLGQIENLKNNVSDGRDQLQNKFTEVQDLLVQSGDKYSSLIQQITSYFEVIEKMVEYQKYLAYNKVLSERVNNEKDVRQFKDYISNTLEELKKIDEDIKTNEETAMSVSDEQFNSIIKNYQLTVEHVSDIIEVEPEVEVYTHVQFPLVTQTLNQLAQLILLGEKGILSSKSDYSEHQGSQNNPVIPVLTLRNRTNDIELSDLFEKSQVEQQQQSDSVESAYQHSFRHESTLKKLKNYQKFTLPSSCQKQILLQNSFSVQSSIVDDQLQSYDEEVENADHTYQKRPILRQIIAKNIPSKDFNKINKMEESFGQYFETDETLMNLTENQRSQTFLLNH